MMCAGGTTPGYRRIDHVIGIAADIVINGKVAKTVASGPLILKKYKEGLLNRATSTATSTPGNLR